MKKYRIIIMVPFFVGKFKNIKRFDFEFVYDA